jgi:hypothetical protein
MIAVGRLTLGGQSMGEFGASEGPGELARAADAIRRYLARIESGEPAAGPDAADIEEDFVRHAAAYSRWKVLSYRDWRQAGVPVNVLTRAGILEFDG